MSQRVHKFRVAVAYDRGQQLARGDFADSVELALQSLLDLTARMVVSSNASEIDPED
jgi:hypothetical protein